MKVLNLVPSVISIEVAQFQDLMNHIIFRTFISLVGRRVKPNSMVWGLRAHLLLCISFLLHVKVSDSEVICLIF